MLLIWFNDIHGSCSFSCGDILSLSVSQAHTTMHSGHPCPELPSAYKEYFKDGITNGAQWYSVKG